MSDAIQVGENAADGPLSVVVTRRIKPGCERAYEELVKGIHEAIGGFDGYLGSHILSPTPRESRVPDHLPLRYGEAPASVGGIGGKAEVARANVGDDCRHAGLEQIPISPAHSRSW